MSTIQEIKKEMTDAFMADSVVREKWGLLPTDEFEQKFKPASIENMLFYIIALCVWTREEYHKLWKQDVENTALRTRYGTKQWWHKMALMWQHGEAVEMFDDGSIGYTNINEEKRLVKYAAIVSEDRAVYVRVAKETNGVLAKLDDDELEAFQTYINQIKPIGISVVAQSQNACEVTFHNKIYCDGQYNKTEVLNNVKTEIEKYLKSIEFGGVLYMNKIIDVVQSVEGVVDTNIRCIVYDTDGTQKTVGRCYISKSGYYIMRSWGVGIENENLE